MRNILLLILAVVGITTLALPVFVIRISQRKLRFSNYIYNLAKNIDYLGGTLLDNTDGHTISANSYYFNISWRIKFINWMFQDDNHCKKAYLYEYVEKAKAGVI